MKNIIFIVNIGGDDDRNKPYHYSITCWKKWADKNNAEVFTLTEKVYEDNYMHLNWHKSLALKLLKENNIEYDQVLIVDADTIVHPDCPNFFEETEGKLCAVVNEGCYEWVTRSIENYFTKKFNVETKLLPSCYNLQDMARKNLFTLGYKEWSKEPLFIKAGWVYHFNAIPANMGDVAYWMKYTYNKLY